MATLRALRPRQLSSASLVGSPAISSQQVESLTLLLQQLRITSEMLKIEASRVGDPALEQMVAVLEGDMKAVARRVAATIAPPDEEEECEPPPPRQRQL